MSQSLQTHRGQRERERNGGGHRDHREDRPRREPRNDRPPSSGRCDGLASIHESSTPYLTNAHSFTCRLPQTFITTLHTPFQTSSSTPCSARTRGFKMQQYLLPKRHRAHRHRPHQRPGPGVRRGCPDGHVRYVGHGGDDHLQHQLGLQPLRGHRAAEGPRPGHAVQPDASAGHLRRSGLQLGLRHHLPPLRGFRQQAGVRAEPQAPDWRAGVPGAGGGGVRGGGGVVPALCHRGQRHGRVPAAGASVRRPRLHVDELRRGRGRRRRGAVRPHHRHPVRRGGRPQLQRGAGRVGLSPRRAAARGGEAARRPGLPPGGAAADGGDGRVTATEEECPRVPSSGVAFVFGAVPLVGGGLDEIYDPSVSIGILGLNGSVSRQIQHKALF
ncbi:uncharacterized protein si:ch211-191a24.4 isoform X1 [Hypomesus transpacificus]|uniref:uncharacterized protein si:ch211-191a24.4 isoform X1 n=1 Tax=Hypomesus transpacificus TaxID=137520 RepID=UPI001F0732D2|nr:uncharacterized protein si:ch211-191a24.4 isoform X1 [Hypomesus transpacificus]XP_046873027.1 uncharacterized protein si:ch211-191a24.4 isoform X1 [Hypomesus transpacificus]